MLFSFSKFLPLLVILVFVFIIFYRIFKIRILFSLLLTIFSFAIFSLIVLFYSYYSSKSILSVGKVPKFSLTNQLGKKITNDDYLGKVYVVEFFFSTCPTICPKMNQNMLKLENHFKDAAEFGIVSITINPSYDTSEVLKSHAEHLGVTSPNWNFLTGNQDYIYEIANKGFNLYAAQNGDAEGGFEHSGLFALVDKKGIIRSRKDNYGKPFQLYSNPIVYYDGLEDAGIEALKQDIKVLLNEK